MIARDNETVKIYPLTERSMPAQQGLAHSGTTLAEASLNREMPIFDPSVSIMPQQKLFSVPVLALKSGLTKVNQVSHDFDFFSNELDIDSFDMWTAEDGFSMIDGFEGPP